MEGTRRDCAACGCRGHCYEPNCKECINDVCTQCRCHDTPPDSTIPDSFTRRN